VADPATTRSLYESSAAGSAEQLGALSLERLRAARPDLVEAIRAEASAELAALREELDHLQACEAARRRRELASRLLKEFHLPDPKSADSGARPMVSELFLETLMAAPDEPAMHRLVQERAELIAAARSLDAGTERPSRPVSREQHRSEQYRSEQYRSERAQGALDAAGFARAIS
jgi:hypothetical protein